MFLKRFITWVIVLIGLSPISLPAQEIVFSTQATANKVGTEDQFQVSFVLQNAAQPESFTPPDFSGFSILSGPIRSSQSNFSIINGRTKRTTIRRFTYVLQAKRKGTFTIKGASINSNGVTYNSNPVTIQVVAGSVIARQQPQQSDDPFADDPVFQAMRRQQQRMMQMMQQMAPQSQTPQEPPANATDLNDLDEKNLKKNVFIKVTVDNTHPHVGQQITASYKLYTRLPMNMQLTQLPSLNGFWSEDFNIPNPPKPTIEKIDGKEYQVFLLKKSALFPQHAGKLVLDPAKAEGVVRVIEKSKSQSPLANDPGFGSLFMDDPFFNDNFFSRYQYKDIKTQLSSQPITINVQPLPTANQPKSFTGAVGHFTVQAAVDSDSLITGGATNFTFTIKGSGNFKLIGNPDIEFPPALSALAPIITDTITSRTPTITGQKTFTYNISPQQPGKFTIPSITFSYFDPKLTQYKTLHTSAIEVHVKQGGYGVAETGPSVLPQDIHDNISAKQTWEATPLLFIVSPWYWGLYVLSLLLFITAWALNRRKSDREANTALWKNKKANKVAWKRLSTARKLLPKKEAHTAFYEEISKAVWLYLSDKLNIPIAKLSKDNITGQLRTKGVDDKQVVQLHELLSECEMALYSPGGGRQQRNHTLNTAFEVIGTLEGVLRKHKNPTEHASPS